MVSETRKNGTPHNVTRVTHIIFGINVPVIATLGSQHPDSPESRNKISRIPPAETRIQQISREPKNISHTVQFV